MKKEKICGIYYIENKINNKKYIGQSVDIKRRWRKHKNEAFNINSHTYNYPIYRAIRKYGIDNFNFKIIEECTKEKLNELEIYWIKYYNSFFEGYNQTLGGDFSSHNKKESVVQAFNLIVNTNLKFKEISMKCNLSYEMVQGINTGRYWNDGREYPIRGHIKKDKNYCCDCGKEITINSKRCVKCEHIHRSNLSFKNLPVSKEELSKLICNYPFTQIGKMYNVTDNAIRKWCKKYGLPYKYNDIKLYKEKILEEEEMAM